MGEPPPPPPPPGAPLLLLVLSLAGSGGGQESKAVFVDQRRFAHRSLPGSRASGHAGAALGGYEDWPPPDRPPRPKKLFHLWERLPVARQLRALGRRRRSIFRPGLPSRPAPSGTKRFAETGGRAQAGQSSLPPALRNAREEKAASKPADPAQRTLPNHPGSSSLPSGQPPVTKQGVQPSLPSLATEVGAVHGATCQCPGSKRTDVPVQEVEGRQVGLRVPTPRTEEAAWAASALTFLLVVLTLAVLYTRLHQKCRRGPSLYWMMSSEEGRDTVAAVMKRRLFSRHRRKRRLRQQPQQQRVLLPSSSSDDSST
ncbi:tumor protein p53-inducible protein 13 isoform 2-T2 [Liasis olivaceus]